jgi:serine/threonine-protein kinase
MKGDATVLELSDDDAARIDALSDEFELAWQSGQTPRIEDFLKGLDDHTRLPAFRELLKVEIELRCNRRESVSAAEYLERFPDFAPAIVEACRLSDAFLATVSRKTLPATDRPETGKTGSGSGRLEVRCPSCHEPTEVAVDTPLTDLTCGACGSHFSLIDRSEETRLAPPLTRIGRFELIERLGVGGFGSVWKARDTSLDRTVAIKIPRHGGMTAEEQEKFFREARAAAQLRHPNIVSVHEVGRDGDSIFIVSDFVRGVTLGDWLTGQQLSSREAAEICARIADALDHAHGQGVVHRDLKPANIMIDGDGHPQLMDFGLARREVGEVTVTMDGQVLGTPAYMSPEQAQGKAHTADRRSDVYSLGVILFQLLTGELPFRGNARMIIHQIIHDETQSPTKLNANIPKDLETITLRCLEKDPARRFQTAGEVAAELRCFLAGEPIHSRPVSMLERRWRWCRRNPAVAGLSATAAALLATVAAVASFGYIRTSQALIEKEQAAATATRVSEFLANLFRASDPIGFGSGSNFQFVERNESDAHVTARELLDRGARRIRTQLKDEPQARLALIETIGGVYRTIGEIKSAVALLEEALALREAESPPDPRKIAAAKNNLAWALADDGQFARAESLYREALATQRQLLGSDNLEITTVMQNLGLLLAATERSAEAIGVLQEAVDIRRRIAGPSSQSYAIGLACLGGAYLTGGDEEKAKAAILEAAVIFEREGGAGLSAGQAITDFQRGVQAMNEGDYAAAARFMEQAIDEGSKLLGKRHPYMLWMKSDHGRALLEGGQHEVAIASLRDTAKNAAEVVGPLHPKVIGLRQLLALSLYQSRQFDEAEAILAEVVRDAEKVLGTESARGTSYVCDMAVLLQEMGRSEEAVEWGKKALASSRKVVPLDLEEEWRCRRELAKPLLSLGRAQEAVATLLQPVPGQAAVDGALLPGGHSSLSTIELYGRACEEAGYVTSATKAYELGLELAEVGISPKPGMAAWFRTLLARQAIRNGQGDKVREELEKAHAVLITNYGEDDDWVQEAKKLLASTKADENSAPSKSPDRSP